MGTDVKKLALELLHADSEYAVIELLKKAKLWDNNDAWRLYGDSEGNFSTIGNQQSRPEAALVEKVVNSVDARLMAECMRRGIDPTSAAAPQSIAEAVAAFFSTNQSGGVVGGELKDWPVDRQREQAKHITIAVTGFKPKVGNACITLADNGEGQTSLKVPETFLSIDRRNKFRIPFVQGKFNMGGTGVLKFCGAHNIQLLITKRNVDVAKAQHEHSDDIGKWSVTVVRRESPSPGAGQARSSVYTFLAPLGADTKPGHGEILTFEADSLAMMPERESPYAREMSSGSVSAPSGARNV